MRAALAVRRVLLGLGGSFFLTVVTTCSFSVDLDKLGNAQCGAGTKLCDGACVSTANPRTGCAGNGCAPCPLDNAISICSSAGQCAIAACLATNKDCNGSPIDGCEVDTDHDPLHCGSCEATPCVVSNATPDCSAGRCAVRSCNTGFGDCNSDATDGCETNVLTSTAHCSKCNTACTAGMTCQSGQCR
jgi:hypothetical protein